MLRISQPLVNGHRQLLDLIEKEPVLALAHRSITTSSGNAPVKHFMYAIANGHVGLVEQTNDTIVELGILRSCLCPKVVLRFDSVCRLRPTVWHPPYRIQHKNTNSKLFYLKLGSEKVGVIMIF